MQVPLEVSNETLTSEWDFPTDGQYVFVEDPTPLFSKEPILLFPSKSKASEIVDFPVPFSP